MRVSSTVCVLATAATSLALLGCSSSPSSSSGTMAMDTQQMTPVQMQPSSGARANAERNAAMQRQAMTPRSQSQSQPVRRASAPQRSAAIAAASTPSIDPDYRMYSYFPAQAVYQSQRNGMFFWQDAAGEWTSGMSLPSSIQLSEANKVEVPLYTDSPHKLHHSISVRFPADFIASGSADF